MINDFVNEYGFQEITVRSASKGSMSIIVFQTEDTPGKDIGFVTSQNGVGLGGSEYIRNLAGVSGLHERIDWIVWLEDSEKDALHGFLEKHYGVKRAS